MPKAKEKTAPELIDDCIAEFDTAILEVTKRKDQCVELHRRFKTKLIFEESQELREEFEEFLDKLKNSIEGIGDMNKHIAESKSKMEEAKQALVSHPGTPLESAFVSYVQEDVRLSRKSLAMVLYDYDDMIESVRSFEARYME